MYGKYYMTDEYGDVISTDSMEKWGEWFEKTDRHVAATIINGVYVSTVFLGLDFSFSSAPDASPLLWETMVFGGKQDQQVCWRYTSLENAERGHNQNCEAVRKRFLKKHLHPLDQAARSKFMQKQEYRL